MVLESCLVLDRRISYRFTQPELGASIYGKAYDITRSGEVQKTSQQRCGGLCFVS